MQTLRVLEYVFVCVWILHVLINTTTAHERCLLIGEPARLGVLHSSKRAWKWVLWSSIVAYSVGPFEPRRLCKQQQEQLQQTQSYGHMHALVCEVFMHPSTSCKLLQ